MDVDDKLYDHMHNFRLQLRVKEGNFKRKKVIKTFADSSTQAEEGPIVNE